MPRRISPPTKAYKDDDYCDRRPTTPLWQRLRRPIYLIPITIALLFLYHFSDLRIVPARHPVHAPSLIFKNVDWSRFAYSQYATDSAYLCNAVMVFEALERLGSKADRILFYPQQWDLEIASSVDRDSQLLVKAQREYKVKLMPVDIARKKDDKDDWNGAFAKFLAWGQTQYERILHLDSDITLLKSLDELFLLPSAPLAMPRAHWLLPDQHKLTSLFILLQPSEVEYARLMDAARPGHRPDGEYDMEILNHFYADSAMVLPHTKYGLLSGQFRASEHSNYLGSYTQVWDPDRVIREASLVHFSDWPLPKPWIMWPHLLVGEMMPKCQYKESGQLDNCKNKEIWMGLYDDFRKRRKQICALLSEPAPEWPPRNKTAAS